MRTDVRDVRGRLIGQDPGPFVLEGQDWFALSGASALSWAAILETVEREQRRLIDTIAALKPVRFRRFGRAPSAWISCSASPAMRSITPGRCSC